MRVFDLRYHSRAVLLALQLEARSRAGKPIVPANREGRGRRSLDAREGELAVVASRRAVARFCRLNSCLTRSIVLFQLLEKRYPVRLEIGFRSGGEGPDGHAWVTVDGKPLGEPHGSLDGYSTVEGDGSHASAIDAP
ncbi:MAG: lasso peptide biosynthesis B2 protein [Thermoanaerobaculia bacterium]